MSKYMMVLLLSGAIPFLLSFWPPLDFYKDKRALLLAILSILLIFGVWDVLATWRHHWYFNPDHVWRFRIINLPVEEALFFIIIPFCCIFTWQVLGFLEGRKRK